MLFIIIVVVIIQREVSLARRTPLGQLKLLVGGDDLGGGCSSVVHRFRSRLPLLFRLHTLSFLTGLFKLGFLEEFALDWPRCS